MRKQADTPWFQSFLTFDPAKTIRDVRQPMLLVHGELDKQVPRVARGDAWPTWRARKAGARRWSW